MAWQIFASFYPKHCTLIDYLSGIRSVLCQPIDQNNYTDLLHKTIVCYHGNKPTINFHLRRFRQGFTMDEVIQRVIHLSCHCVDGSCCNVLSLGYQPARDKHNSTGCASLTAHSIVNQHPNSSVTLLLSKPWQTLHSRIGDDLMIHLLRDVSLFVLVRDGCYIQVSGCPMYSLEELSPHHHRTTPIGECKPTTDGQHTQDYSEFILLQQHPQQMAVDSVSSTVTAVPYAPVSITLSPELTTTQEQHTDMTKIKQRANKSLASLEEPNKPRTIEETLEVEPMESIEDQATNKYVSLHCLEEPMEVQTNGMSECTVQQGRTEPIKESAVEYKSMDEGPCDTNDEGPCDTNDEGPCDTNDKTTVEYKSLDEGPCDTNDKTTSAQGKRKHTYTTQAGKKRKLTENRFSRPSSKTESTEFNSSTFCCYLPHNTLLYSTNFKDKFPKNHVLSCTKPSNTGATNLIREIFLKPAKQSSNMERKDIKTRNNTSKKIQRLPKRYVNMRELFVKFVRRHKRCRFDVLLKHHCKELRKVSSSNNQQNSCNEAMPNKELQQYQFAVQSYTPTYQICRFIKAVCNRVIPKEFLGTEENKRTFYNNLYTFIKLKKFERFSLGQMVNRLKMTSCCWLKLSDDKKGRTPLSESEKQKEVFYRWVWWLVRRYIMVILKSFFYITEGASQSKEIFFYRKPVWRVIQDYAMKTMKNTLLQPISKTEATTMLKSSLGYSYMRFLPKSSSVRPITNMRMKPKPRKGTKIPMSINSKLRNVFQIIKFENARKTCRSSSTVFGVDDVYQAVKTFSSQRDNSPLYMVHVDIEKCFDSILLDKLFLIMKRVFKEEQYTVRRYVAVKTVTSQVRKVYVKKVTLAEDCRMFHELIDSTIKEKGLKNLVFVDQVSYIYAERRHILDVLNKHLFQNIVKIGSDFYKQVQGIAQGSILSTSLCSHFYNHMEKRCLKTFVEDESSLLMRWVDDFLFMTPDQLMAEKFLTVMNAGMPKYGCRIATQKTLVNFHTTTGIPVRRINQDKGFPWCGFLIHPYMLNVQTDFSRYQEIHIKDSFVGSLHSQPGQILFKRLSFSLRHKCHPLLLDLHVNTKDVVLTNLYETFYWLASKYYCWCREFPPGRQVADNPVYLSRVVLAIPPFFCSLARRKFQKMTLDYQEKRTASDNLITWVCYQAFIRCLKRKPLFKSVVKVLRKHSSKLQVKIQDCPKLHYKNPVKI